MQELIKVKISQKGNQVVSARDLYSFLDVSERFSTWFERQIKYGFDKNVDYVGCKIFNTQAKQELVDYVLTISCAKEIAMLQKNEKGKIARQYFIECERKLIEQTQSKAPTTLKEALRLALELEEKRELAEARAEEAENKNSLLMHTNKTYTASEIAKEIGFTSAIKLNEFLKDKKVQYKQNGTWLPTAKYSELGYFEIKQEVIGDIVIYHSKITQFGREFILKLHNESF